ncbi:MAG: HAD hydrolase family protein [Treponema sp.]|jgi:hydroxymethylpyrimidine pyrophosphatase-like HAD family hydrolase|nr:HAD hydrolase family protein [Treponema sp.]
MKPIVDMTAAEAQGLRYILMDIDDTLTRGGKLLASAYAGLWKLKDAGLKVIPVTGRPAGWCDCIAREWPVDGVIGENGALAMWEEPAVPGDAIIGDAVPGNAVPGNAVPGDAVLGDAVLGDTPRLPSLRTDYHPAAVRNTHPVLAKIKERALAEFPPLRAAKDQFARLYDLALDFAEEEPVLPLSAAARIRDIALEEGARAKVSSIHVNIWMGDYDKLSMVERFLSRRFGWQSGAGDRELIFAGDSPNDEPMFARFPLSCGVANVKKYAAIMKRLPAFVSSLDCGDGFAEIAGTILAKRQGARAQTAGPPR